MIALTVASALFRPGARSPGLYLAVGGAAIGALAWRRSFPLTVGVLVIAADIAVNPHAQFSTQLSLVLVAYSIAYGAAAQLRWARRRVGAVPRGHGAGRTGR